MNAVSLPRLNQGLLLDAAGTGCADSSGGCVPVNIFGPGNISAAAADFIRLGGLANADEAVQHVAAIVATGDVFDWSEGTAKASFGAELRRNEAAFVGEPGLSTGDALGFIPFDAVSGAINVYEIFAEAVMPILENRPFAESLEIEGGGRLSHYSTAGSVWTWKAGGQWRPFPGLRFRGMLQQAIRAPNVEELFAPRVSELIVFDADDDICALANDPIGRGLREVCIAQGMDPAQVGVYDPPAGFLPVTLAIGGSPDLAAERARTITAGFDYDFDLPFDLRLGADYFSVNIDGAIARVEDPALLCSILKDPTSDVCLAITREPSGLPLEIALTNTNVAVLRSEGVDLSLEFAIDAPAAFGEGSRFSIRSAASVYFKRGAQESAGSPFIDCAGSFAIVCAFAGGIDAGAAVAFPDKQATTTFALSNERFSSSLRWRWVSAIDSLVPVLDDLAGAPPSVLAIPNVAARNYVDLAFSYAVTDFARLRFGVDNVFKTAPPTLGDEAFQSNTDPSRYDVFGRRFFFGVTLSHGGR